MAPKTPYACSSCPVVTGAVAVSASSGDSFHCKSAALPQVCMAWLASVIKHVSSRLYPVSMGSV